MVKKLFLSLLAGCLLCSGGVLGEPLLTSKVDKKIIVLGESLQVEIKAAGMAFPLSSISLDILKQDFNVYSMSSNVQTQIKKGLTVRHETMALILYPLRSGKLHIPALNFHGGKSKAIEIVVTEFGKSAPQVIFKVAIDKARPMVREEATLSLDIYDDGSLQWTAPRELVAANVHQRRLAETQHEEVSGAVRYTVHRYAWALMPLREGKLRIEFPLLDAFRFGTRLRYPVAALLFEAAAAPAYLPVHLPIGNPSVAAEAMPAEIALKRPVNRILSVSGSGLSAEGLSKLLAGMRSDELIQYYPPNISATGNERATSATQTYLINLPFVPLRSGRLQLPEINLPYYNPESARVESVIIPVAEVEVFNPLWRNVGLISLGLFSLAGAGAASYWAYRKLRRILKRRKCFRAIGRASSADTLRRELMKFDAEILSRSSQTLQQWLQDMQGTYAVDVRLIVVVQQLEKQRYAVDNTGMDIKALSSEVVKVLQKLSVRKNFSQGEKNRSLLFTLFCPQRHF